MVLTNAQTATFFGTDMRIPIETVGELANLGIADVESLADYDEDLLKQVKEDLRKPAGTMNDPTYVPAAAGDPIRQIPRNAFVFSPISFYRMTVAAAAVSYYEAVGRPITYPCVEWNGPLRVFAEYMKQLEVKKTAETPSVPKITKSLPVVQWTEAFETFLEKVLGVRDIPLAYVIREQDVPPAITPLMANRPYSAVNGSVVQELVARASHTHALFDSDNELVFNHIEEAVRSTQYSATLSGFRRAKNGRDAWIAIKAQYVGKDKWQKDVKKQENFLHTFIWKGNTNGTLESFINKHRMAFVRIERCAEHITHTVPNDRQRVIYLLDAIKCNDPQLQAALANVRADDQPDGKMNDFEATAAYILPHDPVSGKRVSNKRKIHDIAAVDLGVTKGSTGVDVRYYKPEEYRNLSQEQKQELKALRQANKGSNKKEHKKTKRETKEFKKTNRIADQVIAALEARVAESEKQQEIEDANHLEAQQTMDNMVVAALNRINDKKVSLPPNPGKVVNKPKATGTLTLKSILGRNKE